MGKIGLVLGGGAVRGLAHLGVLKVFDKHGIPIDCIAGTSMGGAIGGLYAAGISPGDIEELIRTTPKYRLIDLGIRRRGLIGGDSIYNTVQGLMKRHGKEALQIEDFPIRFKAVSVDLITGKQVIIDRGDIGLALRATTAFPGVFAPVMAEEKMLVDGGVLNNLPVEELKSEGLDLIIAVDVAREHEPKLPRNMVEVVYRSYSLMTAERKRTSLRLANWVIRPEVGHIAAFDFSKSQECIRAGEAAAERIIDELRAHI
ncbi:patatin [Paenibacillus macerans]|uniref:Patatin n=1 Tax=Paenibacillus macerans TaxID=44252 RepID=A0A6N8EWA4_PAEMA|nr:patatin-like phospholipase family protein [Paenibacillus macerans]MEC0333290.1 patatin-like phospholipase family protein [Paenibacillus macerans]MED4955747.1 patatin-like phospholipase family protein [Paenibacillus macerans]MUG24139.1 patatin [Paenibacillus macerans]